MSRSDMLPFWTDAYLSDTMHLSNEQHGCYLKLLIFAWRQPDCRIKNDDIILKNVLGITPRKLSSLKPILMQFWELKDGYYTQKRLSKEHKNRMDYIKSKSRGNKKSGEVDDFDVQKSSEMFAKKVNENNVSDILAVAVAVSDISSSHSNAREAADLFEKVKSAWCLMAAKNGLPSVEIITPLRAGWIEKRLSDCRGDTAAIFKAIENVPHDNHRLGFSKGGWRADFDWVFGNQQNFLKCLESKPQTETQKQRSENGTQRSNNPSSRIARIGEKRREAGRRAVERYKAERVAKGL